MFPLFGKLWKAVGILSLQICTTVQQNIADEDLYNEFTLEFY
jgi:hypothetical protein